MRNQLTRSQVSQAAEVWRQSFNVLWSASLDYSPASLRHLDDAFDVFHLEGSRSEEMRHVCFTTGCYLAEVMCLALPGAQWSAVERAIMLDDGVQMNVLWKPSKRLDNGPEDSLFDYYQSAVDITLGRIDFGKLDNASRGEGRTVLWRHPNGSYTVEHN